MTKKHELARPATAREVAAELHKLQQADANASTRRLLVDVLARAFGYGEALREYVATTAARRWPAGPVAVPPPPPRLPEPLRLSDELFAVERAVDAAQAAWREILMRPAMTRPKSGFGTKLFDVWIEETTSRARREADAANKAIATAAGKLVLATCDRRVALSGRELATAVERGIASASSYVPAGLRSPYVRSEAPFGDNRQ